ncbi:hypothetical protein ACHWQZ_G011635 [Mnemiopsis leidyi]
MDVIKDSKLSAINMGYCAVQWCKNENGKSKSKIDGRKFLRFFPMPKDPKLAKSWKLRIGRRPEDVTTKMLVCSDHFKDEDFANHMKIKLFYHDKMHIKLNSTAIPNTDSETLELSKHFPSVGDANSDSPGPSKRSRKRVRRDLASVKEFIQEQEIILEARLENPHVDADIDRSTDDLLSTATSFSEDDNSLSVSTQTDLCLCSCTCSADRISQSSRPKLASSQTDAVAQYRTALPTVEIECQDYDFETSSSTSSQSESEDPDYQPFHGDSEQCWEELEQGKGRRTTKMKQPRGRPVVKKTYPISWAIISLQQLYLLFQFCLDCGSRLTSRAARFSGATIFMDYICCFGHKRTWCSSPSYHRYTHINSLLSFSTTLCGIRFSSMKHLMQLCEMPFISKTVFNGHRKKWLFPVIYKMYNDEKLSIMSKLKFAGKLSISGDAQYDSPGFSAKMCTYTIMNSETNEIIDFIVIQKGQYEGELEKQACQLLLEILIREHELDVEIFVTDRHTGIGAMMRENFPAVYHAFDVWHMAKSLQKKLTACAKKHQKVGSWTQMLVRHFWWSCRECKGNVDLLIEMFHSCLFHILDIHNWGRRQKIHSQFGELRVGSRPYPTRPVLMKQCYHTQHCHREGREIPWFNVEDEDFKAVFKIITGTKFTNDVKKCSKFIHTGKLESFHSLKLSYLPKSTGFTMATTVILTMLAAIQNNTYLKSKSKLGSYSIRQWSRANKEYLIKERTVYDDTTFKKEILQNTFLNLSRKEVYHLNISPYVRKPIPKTFHGKSAPSREELQAKKQSRLTQSQKT